MVYWKYLLDLCQAQQHLYAAKQSSATVMYDVFVYLAYTNLYAQNQQKLHIDTMPMSTCAAQHLQNQTYTWVDE